MQNRSLVDGTRLPNGRHRYSASSNRNVRSSDHVNSLEGRRSRRNIQKFHRIERSYGSFLRTFTVPLDTDETKVAADFKAYTPPAPEPPTGATRSPNAMGGPGGMGGGPAPNPAKP